MKSRKAKKPVVLLPATEIWGVQRQSDGVWVEFAPTRKEAIRRAVDIALDDDDDMVFVVANAISPTLHPQEVVKLTWTTTEAAK